MDRRRLQTAAAIVALVALATLLRLPRIIGAEATFNADEAVNALVVKHWFEGEPALFNWDATYYGVVEGVLALPAVALLGFEAPAFRVAPLVTYLLFLVAVFQLGRRLYDDATALLALALLVVGSPMLVLWSSLASGGFILVILWGVLGLLQLARLTRETTNRQWFWLGAVAGFGLYIYELFLVYLPALLAGVTILLVRNAAVPLARRARWLAALAAGGLVGGAFKFIPLFGAGRGTKAPSFDLADAQVMAQNLRLLLREAGPALFGVNPFDAPTVRPWVGFDGPLAHGIGGVLLAAILILCCATTVAAAGSRLRRPDAPTWLALTLMPPLVVVAFLVSRNATDVISVRYLLPAVASLALTLASSMSFLWRARTHAPSPATARSRIGGLAWFAGLAAFTVLGGVAFAGSVRWLIAIGEIGPDLRPTHRPAKVRAVLAEMERQGIAGGYSDYWTSYTATFLSGERIIITPFSDWQRHPAYAQHVAGLQRQAWILAGEKPYSPQVFEEMLTARNRPFEVRRIGPYSLYTSADERPLLNSSAPAAPLRILRAEVEILAAPAEMSVGSTHRVRVRLVNRSDAAWSAMGRAHGILSVRASYRWMRSASPATQNNRRTELVTDVPVGGSQLIDVEVEAPAEPGLQELRVTLVQESVDWFDLATQSMATVPVRIVLAPGAAPAPGSR